MTDAAGQWCLIESDPGVFTELLKEFGVTGLGVEEFYSLDQAEFDAKSPVHGLVFLFKWRPGDEPCGKLETDQNKVYFAQQVITNACATQALINMVLNLDLNKPELEGIKLGTVLEEFRSFTQSFDPSSRGLCLSNSEAIRDVHNSFSRPQPFELDIRMPEKEDNFHFITYVPVNGRVYELDGLREAPIDLGAIGENGDWLSHVKPIIAQRIENYSKGEIHFNLMGVVTDKKMKLQRRLAELESIGTPDDQQALEMCRLRDSIADEEVRAEAAKKENIRRRHNYMPFIVELLKILAKDGKLVPLVEEKKAAAKAESKQKSK
uniref:Ubiquitin carboxyl-terminal hydrolase n=1 Tax=Steinernema glaseri TaxID=37863 RepID=A0A1I8ASP8_9BILA